MSDRIIRDEILDSDRYLGLTSDTARMLFIHFILVADDLGNSDAGYGFIRRRLLPMAQQDAVSRLLDELNDADLVRVYEVDGKRFVHIPRFKQRLRYIKSRVPRPPASVECQLIKDMITEKSDLSQTQVRPKSDSSRLKGREVKRSEEKGNDPKPLKTPSLEELPPSISLLMSQGLTQSEARGFVGLLLKNYDAETVDYAFRESVGKADIRKYVGAILKTKPKKAGTDKVLQKLRDQHGTSVIKSGAGYGSNSLGMRWNAEGEQVVSQ